MIVRLVVIALVSMIAFTASSESAHSPEQSGAGPARLLRYEAMPISFDESFPQRVRRDLELVAADVAAVAAATFAGPPPAGLRPIHCFYREPGPITDSTSQPAVYRVGLSIQTRDYARLVFQLAHELGHIYLDPRRTNGVVETLAVAFSLEALDQMALRWHHTAPHPHWRSFAPEFSRYRTRVERHHIASFPVSVQRAAAEADWTAITSFLRKLSQAPDPRKLSRDENVLGARVLRSRAVDWPSYLGLATQTKPPPRSLRDFRADLPLDIAGATRIASDLARIGGS